MSAERHHLIANREALFDQRRLLSEPCKLHRTERDGRRALVDKPDPGSGALVGDRAKGHCDDLRQAVVRNPDRHGCA